MIWKLDFMVINFLIENEVWIFLKSVYVEWLNNYVYWFVKIRIFLIWYMLLVFWGRGDEFKKKKIKNFIGLFEYEMYI